MGVPGIPLIVSYNPSTCLQCARPILSFRMGCDELRCHGVAGQWHSQNPQWYRGFAVWDGLGDFDHSRASWAGSTGKLCGFFFDFSFAESLEPTA